MRTLVVAPLVALLMTVGGCAAPAVTSPTPGSTAGAAPSVTVPSSAAPVSAVDVAAGEIDEGVVVDVPDAGDGVGVTFREITIAPGAGTGVHCHHGQLIAVVQAGELTHYAATHPDGVRVYATGEAIIEGAGYPHEGVNEGDEPVVLWVTYVIPEGQPLAETDLDRCGP
ncbi:cupin domain-containing protein [Microbacterium sp. NPDC077184]|uniref:cupin domain-containing protein n=1 Tax=Microbacterium sp. NPDC077184 TaxID=3154764 RepID=UPI00341E9E60